MTSKVFVRRFWPEEFSSAGDFGLGRNLWPKTPHLPEKNGEGWEGEGRVVNGFKYCLVKAMVIFPKFPMFSEVSRSSFPRFFEVVFRSDESASSPDGK